MTELPEHRRCRWCGRRLPPPAVTGRAREFCGGSCCQRAYESRLRAAGAGLAENERVVTVGGLDGLRDRLYVLETAIEDVERDLADGDAGLDAFREALDWVLAAARPLVAHHPLDDRRSS